jgi:chromosomal replication initiation ATPase DnaA
MDRWFVFFEKTKQIPLQLEHNVGFSRDELIVTPANMAAVNLIDSWPHWPTNFMVMTGSKGSGKSHLATIWAQKSKALILTPQNLTFALESAPRNILIDGLDNADFDEKSLFHIINSVKENAHSLLITSRRLPLLWPFELPDLISRIKSAPMVEILEPDDDLLIGVITKLFADRQLVVEHSLILFLMCRIERSLDAARICVERLDHLALQQKTRITRQMILSVMAQNDHEHNFIS